MRRIGKFLVAWLICFAALALTVSVIFGSVCAAAIFAYWGEPYPPPVPWFLWRFLIGIAFFISAPIVLPFLISEGLAEEENAP